MFDDLLKLLRNFGSYVIIFMTVCVVETVAIVWWSFAIKRFWFLWDDDITVAEVMLLGEAYCAYVLQRSTVLISM
jgi:hypothetical protein